MKISIIVHLSHLRMGFSRGTIHKEVLQIYVQKCQREGKKHFYFFLMIHVLSSFIRMAEGKAQLLYYSFTYKTSR